MTINVRAKGQTGEREVVDLLNGIIYRVMKEMGYPEAECLKGASSAQRNQNQSAVGGCDISNAFGLAIEVKRQETLSVPAWWRQTVKSAETNNEVPVLMYRQNRKPWHIRTRVWVPLPGNRQIQVEAEFDIDAFRAWFAGWVRGQLEGGFTLRA